MTNEDGGKAWSRLPGESARAFEAFRCYLELGPGRSLRKCARESGKGVGVIERWSARWLWQSRVLAHDSHVAALVDDSAFRHARSVGRQRILCGEEILARLSAVATADMTEFFDDDGQININRIKQAGIGWLAKGIKVKQTRGRHGDEITTVEVQFESKIRALELLARHLRLFDADRGDPIETLAKLIGVEPSRMPDLRPLLSGAPTLLREAEETGDDSAD